MVKVRGSSHLRRPLRRAAREHGDEVRQREQQVRWRQQQRDAPVNDRPLALAALLGDVGELEPGVEGSESIDPRSGLRRFHSGLFEDSLLRKPAHF